MDSYLPVPSPVFTDCPSGRPHVSVENGDRKRNFSKTLSRVEIFENAVFRVCMWTVKMELFENDVITASDLAPDESVSLPPGHL